MSKTIIYFHVYIILDFPVHRNASVLNRQSEFTCLHKTVNMVKNSLKTMKIPTQKESTQRNVQSCPSKKKEGITDVNLFVYHKSLRQH